MCCGEESSHKVHHFEDRHHVTRQILIGHAFLGEEEAHSCHHGIQPQLLNVCLNLFYTGLVQANLLLLPHLGTVVTEL